jgi:hypothetical protein
MGCQDTFQKIPRKGNFSRGVYNRIDGLAGLYSIECGHAFAGCARTTPSCGRFVPVRRYRSYACANVP